MYLSIRKPPRAKAIGLLFIMWSMGVLALCALIGSIYSFIHSSKKFKPFSGSTPH